MKSRILKHVILAVFASLALAGLNERASAQQCGPAGCWDNTFGCAADQYVHLLAAKDGAVFAAAYVPNPQTGGRLFSGVTRWLKCGDVNSGWEVLAYPWDNNYADVTSGCLNGSTLYIGGVFTVINLPPGQTGGISANNLAKLDLETGTWTGLNAPGSQVNAVAVDDSQRIYVATDIGVYVGDGSTWQQVLLLGTVNALTAVGNTVYAGGHMGDLVQGGISYPIVIKLLNGPTVLSGGVATSDLNGIVTSLVADVSRVVAITQDAGKVITASAPFNPMQTVPTVAPQTSTDGVNFNDAIAYAVAEIQGGGAQFLGGEFNYWAGLQNNSFTLIGGGTLNAGSGITEGSFWGNVGTMAADANSVYVAGGFDGAGGLTPGGQLEFASRFIVGSGNPDPIQGPAVLSGGHLIEVNGQEAYSFTISGPPGSRWTFQSSPVLLETDGRDAIDLWTGSANVSFYTLGNPSFDIRVYNPCYASDIGIQCAPVPSGAVGWWPGDGSTQDLIGGDNGILNGGTVFGDGYVNQAFNFNGIDGYVDVPSIPSLCPTGPFSVEAWINFANPVTPSSYGYGIVAKGQDWNGPVDWAMTVGPSQHLRVHVQINGQWIYVDGSTLLQPNTWYHVALVYDGSHILAYVNGVQDASWAASGPVATSSQSLKIGAYAPANGGPSQVFFPGSIDEVTMYNRALSAAELYSIYASHHAGKCRPSCVNVPSGAVAWWPGDDSTDDLIGSNTGTLQGGAFYGGGLVLDSFSLNGAGGYISVPSSSSISPSGPFTVEAWVNYSTPVNPSSNGYGIIAKGQDCNCSIDWAMTVSPNAKLRPHAKVNGSWHYFDCNTLLNPGIWYHVALVYDGSQVLGYVNGVQDGYQLASGPVATSSQSLKIGAYAPVNGGPSQVFFPGSIDEVTMYNRALSPAELYSIYYAGPAGKCKPTQ